MYGQSLIVYMCIIYVCNTCVPYALLNKKICESNFLCSTYSQQYNSDYHWCSKSEPITNTGV